MTDTFTITQTPDPSELYLYPNASIATALIRYPAGGTNYSKVDEVWYSSNDDTDYVYTTNIAAQYDYYGLPNHTTESGTINYVTVVAMAKSYLTQQSSSGTFKLGIQDATYTTKKSWSTNKAPLNMSYNKYYHNFTSTPSGAAWTWAAVDKLNIAIQCSSPSHTGYVGSLTLKPNAAGDVTQLTPSAGNNYACVSDTNDATYVYVSGDNKYDLYNVPNHTTEVGTIDNVTFYRRQWGSPGTYNYVRIKIGTSDRNWDGQHYTSTAGWQSFATVTNPATGVAWTWANIDSLQFGVYLQFEGKVYEEYAIVTYGTGVAVNPEIRTTQCYAVVNYTPPATTLTLNMPESLSVSHGRNIERFLFPAGDYEVIDTGRASKTLQITGYETSTASVQMQSLKTMTHYSSPVTIAGLSDTNLNTDYYITNFDMENVFNSNPPKYRWSLQLEEA